MMMAAQIPRQNVNDKREWVILLRFLSYLAWTVCPVAKVSPQRASRQHARRTPMRRYCLDLARVIHETVTRRTQVVALRCFADAGDLEQIAQGCHPPQSAAMR